jgi:biotin transport system substrate-specific component
MDASLRGVTQGARSLGGAHTVATLFRPAAKMRARLYDLALVLGGSLVIAAAAQVVIPLPVVPVTAQTFAVLLLGALLGARLGMATVAAYLLEGLAGFPVFSEGRSGWVMLAGPTGGYLIGFVVAAGVVGLLAQRGWDRRVHTTVAAMVLGNLVLYGFGVGRLALLVGPSQAVAFGVYPFVLGEVIKVALAAAVLPLGWKTLSNTGWTRGRDFGGQDR